MQGGHDHNLFNGVLFPFFQSLARCQALLPLIEAYRGWLRNDNLR